MTTTELLATPATDKHLSWMHGVLSHVKFRPEYANATLELTYNRVKGETLDSFAVFTLADGTVTRLSSGHGKGDLNGVQAPWPETRKAFLALAALPKEAKAPKAKAKEEKPAEALVAEAAAPAKPKRARKAKAPKTEDLVPEAEAFDAETVERALHSVFG